MQADAVRSAAADKVGAFDFPACGDDGVMTRMRLALAPTVLLLAAPVTAGAQTQPPGAPHMSPSQARAALAAPGAQSAEARGQTRGVRARRGRRGVVVSFSGPARRLFRRSVAGRRVEVTCTRLGREGLGISLTTELGETLRAPRSRPRLRTGLRGRFDYCEIIRPAFTRRPSPGQTVRMSSTTLATDALTERGTVLLDERERAQLLSAIVTLAGISADERMQDTYPQSEPFVKKLGSPSVVLGDPLATPPEGKVRLLQRRPAPHRGGTLTERGRRLFIDINGDVVATNLPYSFGGG